MNKFVFITIFLLMPGTDTGLWAQTVSELYEASVSNNSELKQFHAQYFAALEAAPQVRKLPDLELGAGVFPFPVETRLGAQLARLSATQMFYWPGVATQKTTLENTRAQVALEQINALKPDLRYQLQTTYLQLYENKRRKAILQQHLPLLETLEQIALAHLETGKGATTDVFRAQLKTIGITKEIQLLKQARLKHLASINQLLNRPPNSNVSTIDSLGFARLPYDRDSLKSSLLSQHPSFRVLDIQQQVARQAIRLNNLNRKPSFGVGIDYIAVEQRTDATPDNNGRDIVQLRASIRLPIYQKGAFRAKDLEEERKIEALEYKKEDLLSRFITDLEQAYADHETARIEFNANQQQVEIVQSAIRILETTYSTNGQHFDELLQLETDLIDYELKKLRAIVQSHLALSRIELLAATTQ